MGAPRFEHFEVVRINDSPTTRRLAVTGRTGVVLGISAESMKIDHYAVQVEPSGEVVMLSYSDLEPTGERASRNDVYGETTIHVTKEGHVAPHPPRKDPQPPSG